MVRSTITKFGLISLMSGSVMIVSLCYFHPDSAMMMLLPQIVCEFGISIVVSTTITKALQAILQYAGAGSAFIGFLRFMLATVSSYLVMKFHGVTTLPLAFIILILALLSLECLRYNKRFSRNTHREINISYWG